MSTSDEVHVGDVGTIFEVTLLDGSTPLDISGSTERKILLRAPDDTVLVNDADLVSGEDGKMQYITVSGDIDIAGRWSIQAKVVIPEGTFFSDIAQFVVEANLA
jgi:hypothetical protein